MNTKSRRFSLLSALLCSCVVLLICGSRYCHASGVTIITHGLDGNTDGWITGMANSLTRYSARTTNAAVFKLRLDQIGGYWQVNSTRISGNPATTLGGEIIVMLDWSQWADGNSYDTHQIAAGVVPALISATTIPELGGHALTEFPMHLIGHSRGGSLMCEISRLLGTGGVWVDHVTTLDPHPLNDAAFPLDLLLYSAVDAPVRTYENVVFHDNYWQDIAVLVFGEPAPGAYTRKLGNLSGGYQNAGDSHYPHSNVHLWYHGTLDFRSPASDTEASVTSTERSSWWNAYESQGLVAGLFYSLVGGGDRLSSDQPLGPGFPAIRDGYNQHWDFGAGTVGNRTTLSSNSGAWPNVIKLNRTDSNRINQGESVPVKFYYQWAQTGTASGIIGFYLDDDLNPLNSNQVLLKEFTFSGTGGSVSYATVNLPVDATNATPGYHAIYARMTANGNTRYLYAPEFVEVVGPTTRSISLSGNLAFGSVQVGTSLQRTLTISNSGSTTLTVSGITYPQGFSGDWSGTIPAGGSHDVTTTFSPSLTANYRGDVQVQSDATTGISSIAVSGTGVPGSANLSIKVSASPASGGNVSGGGVFEAGSFNTVTAFPYLGYTFLNWTEGGVVVSDSPVYFFTVESSQNLVAHFTAGVFVSAKGNYSGLFHEADRIAQQSCGCFALSITDKGRFTARFQIGSGRYSGVGMLNGNGEAQFVIPRGNKPPLTATLHVDFEQGTDSVTGSVSDGTWTASLSGDRAVYDGRLSIAPQTGKYTMILPGSTNAITEPEGDGYGTITVNSAGKILFGASLADGTKITQSAAISKYGQWPLYVSAYSGQGFALSWITFTNSPTEDLAGDLVWNRPNGFSSKYYPGGFDVMSRAWGSGFSRLPASASLLGLADAYLVLEGADLAQTISNHVLVGSNNHVTNLSSNKLNLSFTVSSGLFKGSVVDPATQKPIQFNGVVLQKGSLARGCFLRSNRSGRVFIEAEP